MSTKASNTVRGIEHVGITVSDIEEATAFLIAAFGAEILFDLKGRGPDAFDEEADRDSQARLGTRPGARWVGSRMLRLGDGPSIELFEYADDGQRPPATASDLGIQHFALYVDDIDAARSKVIEAGGTVFAGPTSLPGLESGANNKWLYTLTPWGSIIELVSLPSPQQYEALTSSRRWKPGDDKETTKDAVVASQEES